MGADNTFGETNFNPHEQIKVDGVLIFSAGDPSTGIFAQSWTLVLNDTYLQRGDLGAFVEAIRAVWEYIADDAKVSLIINTK